MLRAALLSAVMAVAAAPAADAAELLRVTTNARAVQPGEVVLFTINTETPVDTLRGSAFGRDLPAVRIAADAWQAVLGIDLATPPKAYSVSFKATQAGVVTESITTLAVSAKQFPTRRLRVDPTYVNPPRATLERITKEAAELADVWVHSAETRLWVDPFIRPLTASANSSFGLRSVFNGEPRQPHGGADFPSPTGTPVQAPNSGRVVLARDLYFTGNTIVIDHGLGVFSLFAHLSGMDVALGDTVSLGQVIGQVGQTGRVTGPHLHWAVRVGSARVDPLAVLEVLGVRR